jgi:hypothetical protein
LTISVADSVGVETTGSLAPRVYYKKNTGSYSPNGCSLTGGTGQNATFDCVIDYTAVGGAADGDSITYFVVAQDTSGNLGSNPGGAIGTSVNNVTPPSSPNLYIIGNGTIPAGTYSNLNAGNNTLGGNVTVTGTLTLDGVTTTGSFTLTIDCNGTVSGGGSAAYIAGNLQKNFCGAQSFTYDVGSVGSQKFTSSLTQASDYSPMTANITAIGTNPSSLTVSVTDDFLPGAITTNSVSRYWMLTETGSITADLSFTYTDADVNGDESTYKVLKRENNSTIQFFNSTNNPTTNTATVNGISEFSPWSVGNTPFAPTAAMVNVGGRVTNSRGRGIFRARIRMTDSAGIVRHAFTNSFGYYRFAEVEVGQTLIFDLKHKGYNFMQSTQIVSLSEETMSINFTAY